MAFVVVVDRVRVRPHTTALGGSNTPFFNEADRQLAAYESEISLANG